MLTKNTSPLFLTILLGWSFFCVALSGAGEMVRVTGEAGVFPLGENIAVHVEVDERAHPPYRSYTVKKEGKSMRTYPILLEDGQWIAFWWDEQKQHVWIVSPEEVSRGDYSENKSRHMNYDPGSFDTVEAPPEVHAIVAQMQEG